MNIKSLLPIGADAASSSTGTSSTSASSASSNANGLANPNLFISLLTAQLKAQDPLNPMSPQDMVNQLTEVSSLQQLVNINQTLTKISTGTTPPMTSQSNPLG
jgi:flagellar basal-body rod modification protein FlgD